MVDLAVVYLVAVVDQAVVNPSLVNLTDMDLTVMTATKLQKQIASFLFDRKVCQLVAKRIID